jgi:hypothetical protein
MNPEPLIPTHGGYRKLKSFQVAQLAEKPQRFLSVVEEFETVVNADL